MRPTKMVNEEIELSREEIASNITLVVSADRAIKELEWRLKIASIFFYLGCRIIGCNIKIVGKGNDTDAD
jgi:hypothetical protein